MSMKRCLIAENNRLYSEFFQELMAGFGYEAHIAHDGLDALEQARDGAFDLFVFDYVMPKIDGIRLCRYIRSISRYVQTPIVLITAAALEHVEHHEGFSLADRVVAKAPIDTLRDVFARMLPDLESGAVCEAAPAVLGSENIYPRQIVRELLQFEIHHNAIFRNISEGVAEFDGRGKIVTCNPSFCKFTGREEGDVVGRSIDEILDFAGNVELQQCCRSVQKTGEPRRETAVTMFWGKAIQFSFYNIPGDEERASAFVVLQDVSEIKRNIDKIGSLFNISQAFLSNLSCRKSLEYVIYELRRLLNAAHVTLLPAGGMGGDGSDPVSSVNRRLDAARQRKIAYWLDKVRDWKKEGLVSSKSMHGLSQIRLDEIPLLFLPLSFRGRSYGTVMAARGDREEFGEDDIKLFETVGNQLSVFLANLDSLSRAGDGREGADVPEQALPAVDADSDEITGQMQFMRWDERNRRLLLSRIVQRMNRSCNIMKGYLGMLGTGAALKTDVDTEAVTGAIASSFDDICLSTGTIALYNKFGTGERANLFFFDLAQLESRLRAQLAGMPVTFAGAVAQGKMLGDVEKLAFCTGEFVREMLVRDIASPGISFECCNNNICMVLSLVTDGVTVHEQLGPLVAMMQVDEWEEVDDFGYFLFWHLRNVVAQLNGAVVVTDDDGVIRIECRFLRAE